MNDLSAQELKARLILHNLPTIGGKRFFQLVNHYGSADIALHSQTKWQQAGLPSSSIGVDHKQAEEQAEQTLHWLESEDQQLIFWDSPYYPALLKEISDFPPILYAKGNISLLEKPQLAIVGSRHASKPGLDTAYQFAKKLAEGGFVITSGLALGIDGAAHSGALASRGETIAVLGCGLQHMYPKSHHKLAQDIIENNGTLISEFPLNTAPQASNFPRRNRIISGLSLGTLVVEASLSSGSLITAKLAAEQGREVFAIPGSIHYAGVKGCHQLIREGATLVESIDHILDALQGWKNIDVTSPLDTQQSFFDSIPDSLLLKTLKAAPQSSESLAMSLDMPFDKVLIELTDLELQGSISCEAGIWYALHTNE